MRDVTALRTRYFLLFDQTPVKAIPTSEIVRVTDALLSEATHYAEDTVTHQECLTRADYYMDLIDSWRQSR